MHTHYHSFRREDTMKKPICLISALLLVMMFTTSMCHADNQYEQVYEFVTILDDNTAMAYWIEDTAGNYLYTVYVTHKVAKIGMGITRPSILPVWAARRIDEWGSGYPTTSEKLPDAVSSATPPAGTFTWAWNVPPSLPPGEYYYFVEVNLPWDPNDYYENYTRGQPSVVFRGSLTVDSESTATTGAVVGHGHETGANGNLATTIDSLTTALEIISAVSVNHYLAPLITTPALPDTKAGSAYNVPVSFVDQNTDDSHTFSLLAGPDWMSVDESGAITGTPGESDVAGDVAVAVTVTDSYGLADTLSTAIVVESALDVDEQPLKIVVKPPYPNPFNSSTTFQYELPETRDVRLAVYDITGREVAVLEDGRLSGGIYTRTWSGNTADNLTAGNGIYFYRFIAGDHVSSGKLLFLK